jgi:tight adherence protein B
MNPMLVSLSTFAGVTLAVLGGCSLVFDVLLRDRARINTRFREEFLEKVRQREKRSALFKDPDRLAREVAGGSPGLDYRLETAVEQSGLLVTWQQVGTIAVAASVAAASIVAVITWNWPLAFLAGVAGLITPPGYVAHKRKQRLSRLRAQLPEAFELMSRSVQSGQTIPAAFQTIADDFDAPLAEEFARCHEQQNLGLPYEVALRELARRTGVVELQMFVVALLVQRKCGGSPVELLGNLALVMRKRLGLRGKVRALTGEGRMQALVLLLLPVGMFIAIWFIDPTYAGVLWERPKLLAGALFAELVGAVWIRRIVNFDF